MFLGRMVFFVFEEQPEGGHHLLGAFSSDAEAKDLLSRRESVVSHDNLSWYHMSFQDHDEPLSSGDPVFAVWFGAESQEEKDERVDPSPSMVFVQQEHAQEVCDRLNEGTPFELTRLVKLTLGEVRPMGFRIEEEASP